MAEGKLFESISKNFERRDYNCIIEKIDKGNVSSLINDKIINKLLRLARKI